MYKLYKNIDLALTLKGAFNKEGRNISEKDLSIIKKPQLLTSKNKIIWIGHKSKFSTKILKENNIKINQIKEIDLKHKQIMPSFVECHTHSVFAGHRQSEFELRNQGVSYQEISRQGGGIQSTVKHTRKESFGSLVESFKKRVKRFKNQGVSVLEVKSGYGLNLKTEKKILSVIKEDTTLNTVSTFLGPHACPTEFTSYSKYMDYIISKMLPNLLDLNLLDRADIFIEKEYFANAQADRYFNYLNSRKVPLTCHIDQLTNSKMISNFCKYEGMQSMDHLVCIDTKGISALSKSKVTAVLLPTADFYLKMNYPPARKLIEAGARVALATDFNPGSAPSQDLSFVGVLARLEMNMSLAEVITSYTLNSAYSLGLGNKVGSLTKGKSPHFVTLSDDYDKLFYEVGYHPIDKLYMTKL